VLKKKPDFQPTLISQQLVASSSKVLVMGSDFWTSFVSGIDCCRSLQAFTDRKSPFTVPTSLLVFLIAREPLDGLPFLMRPFDIRKLGISSSRSELYSFWLLKIR